MRVSFSSRFPSFCWCLSTSFQDSRIRFDRGLSEGYPRAVGAASFGKASLYSRGLCVSHFTGSFLNVGKQDRENESRFGATPVPGKIGMAMAGQGLHAQPPPRPPSHNFFGHSNPGNQLYVGNVRWFFGLTASRLNDPPQLPYQAGWQDLKDLFRTAGNIVRADINIAPDGRPKGSGTVVFETAKDAQQAISACTQDSETIFIHFFIPDMYHGFDWYGRILEVREVGSFYHRRAMIDLYPRIAMQVSPDQVSVGFEAACVASAVA